MKIGQGFDAHRFTSARPLVLGGETIAYEFGLLGHSDADVLTHAVMDALLGAAGLPDIGRCFPDSDEAYRGIDSLLLLERVGTMVAGENYSICSIDATIIAQKPKLSGYLDKMIKNLAKVLKIEEKCINMKATTTEGMGFTGRGEGIGALAVCLLEEMK